MSVAGRQATITLKNFTEAIESSNFALFNPSLVTRSPRAAGLVIRYNVRVTAPKKIDNKRILAKRNELTLKRLKPGSYTVKYSANAYRKRSKKQIEKLRDRGKTGFTLKFKKVFGTNVSPTAGFTIN